MGSKTWRKDKELGHKAKLDKQSPSEEKEEYISGGVCSEDGRKGGSLGGIEKAGIETAATMSRAGKAPSPFPSARAIL